MFVFGLLLVSAVIVLSTLANPIARGSLRKQWPGLIKFIGWFLVFVGTALQLIDGLSN